ncbi:MAG: FAD-binding oxidoreductase [Candidatus Acidiferrales bacterium]
MTTTSTTIASGIAAVIASPHLIEDPAQLAAYEIEGMKPAAAVRPGTSEEVAEVVKFAAAAKLALVTCGARTKLSMGMPPQRYDLALDLSRLDRVVAYDPGDLTLSVEAGVPLAKLAEVLAKHGQFLPLMVPYLRSATVGGTVASGVDAPLRQAYGTARDFILGMEFVTGEGSLVKSGGRVVKNVTGYDLHKLMAGAMGTLGAITKINFRTFPRLGSSRAFVAAFDGAADALAMRHRIGQSSLSPLTLEILSPSAAGLFSSDAAARIEPAPYDANVLSSMHWTLTAGFAGNDRVLERYGSDLGRMARESGAVSVKVLAENELSGAFGRKREFVPIALDSSPATTIVKIGVLPRHMKDIFAAAANAADAAGLRWVAMARGVGVIYLALLPSDRNDDSHRRVAQFTEKVLPAAAEAGGHATIPWCPSGWKTSLRVWGLGRSDLPQMQKLKAVFDPHNVFSPGRFVGRL